MSELRKTGEGELWEGGAKRGAVADHQDGGSAAIKQLDPFVLYGTTSRADLGWTGTRWQRRPVVVYVALTVQWVRVCPSGSELVPVHGSVIRNMSTPVD